MTNPEIKERLRDYQIQVVRKVLNGLKIHPFFLDASDMGVGKSYSAVATLLALKSTPLVICKKAGITAWTRIWKDHFSQTDPFNVVNYEALRYGNTPYGKWVSEKVGKRNKEVFRFEAVPNMTIVWDEVQTARSSTSQNGEMLMACHDQKIRGIGLSATAVNSPLHFKSLSKCLGLKSSNNWLRFQLEHGVKKEKFGFQWWCGMNWADLYAFSHYNSERKPVFRKRANGWEELGRRQAAVMQGLHLEIFGAGKGIRLRKQDIPGFPKLTVIPYTVDFNESTPAIREAYQTMKRKLASEEGRRHQMAIRTEAQMTVELLKIKGLKEDIEQSLEEGNSVCCFLNFNKSVDMVAEMFNTTCIVRGGQTPTLRQFNIDAFQSNKEKLIILNNAAGGDTIGLHDTVGLHPRVSFIMPTTWAEMARQCVGRTPRNGAMSPSIAMFPFALGTSEERVMELMREKFARIDAFNDAAIIDALTG